MKALRLVSLTSSSAPACAFIAPLSRRFASSQASGSAPASSSCPPGPQPISTNCEKVDGKFKFELPAFAVHRLDINQMPTSAVATKEELMAYYYDLFMYRRFEIAADNLYKQRLIRGFCHLYDGQEAIAVGMEAALTKKDHIITAYRDHCTQMGRGDTPRRVMAELLGRATGSSGGKGGSMHMYLGKNNFYGGNGIVGAQQAVGTGLGFAIKYSKQPNVAIIMYGDGAANQGQLCEASNMAGLWKLPCIYVCENNHFGMGTAASRAAFNTDYYTRGDRIPGFKVNGMDVLAVREAFKWAKNYCVTGNGPLFVEIDTYRYRGHSMSDPGVTYRSREEVQAIRSSRDPIDSLKKRLLDNEIASADDVKELENKAKAAVEDAVKFAQESPEPEPKELYTNILNHEIPAFIRGVESHLSLVSK